MYAGFDINNSHILKMYTPDYIKQIDVKKIKNY